MKKLLLSVGVAVCTLFSVNAQTTTTGTTQPPTSGPEAKGSLAEIEFEKTAHDYGTIKAGANGVYEFKFKNTGKEPLIISHAQGSCGCTVPKWPQEPIKPGESGVIQVSYDTKRVGPFNKSVTITSNAKTEPTKVISITGVVEAVAEPAPGSSTTVVPVEQKK